MNMILRAFDKRNAEVTKGIMVFGILILLWPLIQRVLRERDAMVGYVDPGIVVLILIAVISFLGLVGLCYWLMNGFLKYMGLPHLGSMVLQFTDMELWVQLGFYFASFALLLLSAMVCLVAVL
ncbi:MAG TPA: hypothetical protein VKB19_15620 [Pedobacter sp.]|nr:hypothetical protein [Pedobacter sp.]